MHSRPSHPYTHTLLPQLPSIEGFVPPPPGRLVTCVELQKIAVLCELWGPGLRRLVAFFFATTEDCLEVSCNETSLTIAE